jgi:Phosphate-selective porin O and P
MKLKFAAALLAGSAISYAAPALAQDPSAAQDQPVQTEPDQSDSTADATIAQSAALNDAQAKLEMLQAQVDALQTSIDEMKKESVQQTPAWKNMEWASGTKISGKAFFNVSNISQKSDGADSIQNGTQTELKRFYLGVDHKFNDMFSANLTTDFRYNSNGTSKDVLVYLKKAYFQAKFSPAFFVRIGEADLPWVPFAESVYGYRFIETTLIDRTKFGTSADWGVHAGGTIGNGLLNYAFSAINGAGYKTLSRSSDTIDLEGRISVSPIKPITVGVGAYTGKLGKSSDNLPESATPHRASRFNALAAYTNDRVRFGVEYFAAKNWNNVTTTASDKSNGWSVFSSFAFTPQIGVFGRYDWVKPSRELNPALKDHYFNVGLDYKPIPPLDLALVYKRDRARNGLISTSNGTIGGVDHGIYDEVGLFGQFAF